MTNLEMNRDGIAEMLNEASAVAHLRTVTQAVADEWGRLDPRNKPGGHHPPTITVQMDTEDGVPVGLASTDDSIWHIIERGSINNPPYRPATNAAINSGLDVRDVR